MVSLYWVGVNDNWFTASNWSQSSGGPGNGWVPTSVDDVVFDGGGYIIPWVLTPIVCNNLTMTATCTEFVILDGGGIIYGDFSEAGGYFGPGGTLEFKGNLTKTGGDFYALTDGYCFFSGTGKTFTMSGGNSPDFESWNVTRDLTFAGTSTTMAYVGKQFDNDGSLILPATYLFVVYNGSVGSLVGQVTGDGRFEFYGTSLSNLIPDMSNIKTKYIQFYLPTASSTHHVDACTWSAESSVEINFGADNQTIIFDAGRHYFMSRMKVYANSGQTNATIQFDGDMWFVKEFTIDSNSFTAPGVFHWKLGNGVHVFKHKIELYFNAAGSAGCLDIQPGGSTCVLWGTPYVENSILYPVNHRMSRIYSTPMSSYDLGIYNNVILWNPPKSSAITTVIFLEGFQARNCRYEGSSFSYMHRRTNVFPNIPYYYRFFDVASDEGWTILLRDRLATGSYPWLLNVTNYNEPFSFRLKSCNASGGVAINTYRATETVGGSPNTNINWYERDLRRMQQVNVLEGRNIINSTPPNQWLGELMLQTRR